MLFARDLRWIGFILLIGVFGYAIASIASEPFERETPQALYLAISVNVAQWRFINGLVSVSLMVLLVGFWLLTRALPRTQPRLILMGLLLFGLAVILWLVEATFRMTTTVSIAADVTNGAIRPITFPGTIGVGLEILFLAYLTTVLGGMAVLLWGISHAGVAPPLIAYGAAALTILSGSMAAATYPWVGGVERAVFYPVVAVWLPLSVWLIIRGNRLSPRSL